MNEQLEAKVAPTITMLTSSDIRERKAKLLEEAAMTLADLQARRTARVLDERQDALLRELEDLEFLEGASSE